MKIYVLSLLILSAPILKGMDNAQLVKKDESRDVATIDKNIERLQKEMLVVCIQSGNHEKIKNLTLQGIQLDKPIFDDAMTVVAHRASEDIIHNAIKLFRNNFILDGELKIAAQEHAQAAQDEILTTIKHAKISRNHFIYKVLLIPELTLSRSKPIVRLIVQYQA